MTKKQVYNVLKISIIAVLVMFLFEILFYFDEVTNYISDFIASVNGYVVYVVIYFVILIQVSFIPLPVYVIINAAIVIDSINLNLYSISGWIFIFVTMLAYMTGVVISYFIGKKWGSKAVIWCAGSEEEYLKWVKVINTKGKWFYALTVLLPVFPDDLLCLVIGSVKLNFWFYFFVNLICRFIGLVAMIYSLQFVNSLNSSGFPFTLVGWGTLLLVLIVACIVLKIQLGKDISKTKKQ